ncbi:MAG: hypothetical protein HFF75_01555 [Oscillospiraceae bacterium]|nr:hypothetical protein [Oscillospiraceae bacterium]
MNKDDILAKSRAEHAAAYMDERERELRLREDSAAFGFGLLLGLVLFTVKVFRGQNASDILALVTGMSAAGFFYRLIKVKSRKKFDILWASLCTLMTLFFLYRFFAGAP